MSGIKRLYSTGSISLSFSSLLFVAACSGGNNFEWQVRELDWSRCYRDVPMSEEIDQEARQHFSNHPFLLTYENEKIGRFQKLGNGTVWRCRSTVFYMYVIEGVSDRYAVYEVMHGVPKPVYIGAKL